MSKSMDKRLAVQRPKPEPRFVQGYRDGSGLTCIRDLHAPSVDASRIEGKTIAVSNWGCSCCEGEDTQERIAVAKRITQALNLLDAIETASAERGHRVWPLDKMSAILDQR